MARKKKRPAATDAVWHLTAEEATLAHKPYYNAHICRTGAHGSAKYDRNQQKRRWKQELSQEGTRFRGSLPFCKKPTTIVWESLQVRVWSHARRGLSLRNIQEPQLGANAFYGILRHDAVPGGSETTLKRRNHRRYQLHQTVCRDDRDMPIARFEQADSI